MKENINLKYFLEASAIIIGWELKIMVNPNNINIIIRNDNDIKQNLLNI